MRFKLKTKEQTVQFRIKVDENAAPFKVPETKLEVETTTDENDTEHPSKDVVFKTKQAPIPRRVEMPVGKDLFDEAFNS